MSQQDPLRATATYDEAVQTARELIDEPGFSPEYERGMVNLIADLWGKFEMPTDERMVEVARDVGVGTTWPTHVPQATYLIRRFHRDESHPDHHRIIRTGLTLAEAQAHCQDESTSERDDEGVVWFDGYDQED